VTATAADVVRCATWSRQEGLDPIGTAGWYQGFLLVELPLPWPADINEHPEVAQLSSLLDGRGLRVQALVPAGGPRQVVLYRRGLGAGSVLARYEGVVRPGVPLPDVVAALLDGGGTSCDGPLRDVLVCTHGRRDICCGSMGTALALQLKARWPGEKVRLWRTSHTGGHRFAPNVMVLPEATLWGYADADLVEWVLDRRGDPAGLTSRYRGCATLGSPAVQALEREVLRRVGWGLLDRPRRGEELGGGRVRLVVEAAGGPDEVWEARVLPGRHLPAPDCGRPLAEAHKTQTELVVTGLAVDPRNVAP